MIYETKVSYTIVDSKGNDKVVKESYIVEDAETFCDAEQQTWGFFKDETGFDVTDIKRSKIKEIINTRNNDEQKIFLADVADITINDDGDKVEIIYKIALFAADLDAAYSNLKKHLEQGYSMTAIGVKKSNFVDIITY